MTADAEDHREPVAVASYATTGEAEVVQAKLRAFGIEAELVDQVEGGVILTEGEPGVFVAVPAADAEDALRILAEDGVADEDIAAEDIAEP